MIDMTPEEIHFIAVCFTVCFAFNVMAVMIQSFFLYSKMDSCIEKWIEEMRAEMHFLTSEETKNESDTTLNAMSAG